VVIVATVSVRRTVVAAELIKKQIDISDHGTIRSLTAEDASFLLAPTVGAISVNN